MKRIAHGLKILNRFKKASFPTALLVLVFTGWIIFNSYFAPQAIQAAWFNDNWAYREAIPIAAHTAAETNVYETFQLSTSTLITAGKLQSACQDIRITDVSGNLLNYHVGRTNGCNNVATTVDFLIPTMPAGAQTYYIYYGNPSAVSADAGAFSQSICGNSCSTNPALNTEENAPSPTLYWKFDDAQGTTARDSTSNANSGTLGGTTIPTWQTEDMCISGKCLYFDGTSSKVTGSKIVKNVQTIALWVRPNTLNATNALIDLDGGTHKITSNASGTLTATGFVSPTIYVNGISGGTLTVNRWNFVEVTTGTGFDSTATFTIGTDTCSTTCTNFTKGFFDEIKIYPIQRSASQVAADFNARGDLIGSGENTSNNTNLAKGNFSDGLVGYWKMDEASWNGTSAEAKDSSGLGGHMTSACTGVGCTDATTTTGKFGNGGSFTRSGTTGKFISNSDPTNQVYNFQTMSISAWVNTSSTDNEQGIFSAYNSQYYISVNGTNMGCASTGKAAFVVYIGGFTGVCGTKTVNDGKWHHIVGVRNTTTSQIYLYVDGVLDASATSTGTVTAGFGIASHIGNLTTNYYDTFTGTIDEVRVYNRALSSSEVSQLYNFAAGPVAYYKFDEGSGTTVIDTSGNANTGTWNGTLGSQWKTGKYGGAGNFNGSDNNVVINPLNGNSTKEETWSFWINQKLVNLGTRTLVSIGSGSGASGNYFTIIEQNGAICLAGCSLGTANNAITVNTWTHIALVQSVSNNSCKIYLNGVLQASGSSCPTSAPNNSFLEIGADSQNGLYEQGMIDDFKYYNYARTPKQIIEDMNGGRPFGGNSLGEGTVGTTAAIPVGYWKFDEGYGTGAGNAHNSGSCGSTCDGNLTNTPTWTNSGKFGKALSFSSASSQYVTMPSDVSPLKITSDLSLSAWVNLTSNNVRHSVVCKTTGTASTSSYCLYTNASGQLAMDVSNGTTITTTTETSQTLSNNTWYHVGGVYSAANSVTLYINAIQVTQNTTSIPSTVNDSTTALTIGADNSGAAGAAANFMNGIIDEPKVYAGALTADQVKIDMNRGFAQNLGNTGNNSSYQTTAANQEYCVPGDTTSCAAPAGRWDFEEASGSIANDISGNGNTGTLTNSPIWTTGKIGNALKFNGATTYVSLPATASVKNQTQATIEAWVNLKALPTISSAREIYSEFDNGGNAVRFGIEVGNNWTADGISSCNGVVFDLFLNMGNVAGVTQYIVCGTTPVTTGTWYHVVGVFDSVSGKHKLYVNGKLDNTLSQPVSAFPNTNPALTFIGSGDGSSGSTLNGIIDQVRLFYYARSAAQIAWDYNRGGPIGWWKFDDCQGTTIHDSTLNNYNGTQSGTTAGTCLTSSTFWGGASGNSTTNSGKINYAGTFTAANSDNIQTAAISPIAASGNTFTGVSWGGWYYPITSAASVTLMEKATNSTTAGEFHLYTNSSSQPVCGIFYLSAFHDASAGSTPLTVGAWNHVICVYDGTNIYTYLNGVQIGKSADTNSITAVSSILYLGESSGALQKYNGRMDEVVIYNYPLTQTQINIIYTNGAINYAPTTGAP